MKTVQMFAVSLLAVASLLSAGPVSAMPSRAEAAQRSSVDLCVAQIADQANYDEASRVLHNVTTKERRVGGHIMQIETFVYVTDGEHAARKYATTCSVARTSEIRFFKFRQVSNAA